MDSNKNLIIPDANVILKWLIKEKEFLTNALDLRRDHKDKTVRLLIPVIAEWEVNNFIGRKFADNEAITILSNFHAYKIPKTMLSLEQSYLAFKIMNRCRKVSFYDASYHALAIDLKGTFLTADENYFQKAKGFKHIKLLGKY